MNDVLELERQFWGAAGNADFYRRRFADDGRCVFGFGVLDKQATVASMASATPWTTFELQDVSVIEVAPQVTVLTYMATATRDGQDPYEAAVSSVHVERDGDWELVLHQQSPRMSDA